MTIPQPESTATVTNQHIYKYFATTVALITSHHPEKGSNVMACEWTMNVSWSPLRVMSIVHHEDYTHELIAASREFGVNLCSDQQAALANYAGNISGRNERKLEHALFAGQLYPATHIKAPMIRGCLINAECVVEETVDFGEYTGFIGLALVAQAALDLKPLFYHQGKFAGLGEWIVRSK